MGGRITDFVSILLFIDCLCLNIPVSYLLNTHLTVIAIVYIFSMLS